MNKHLKLVVNNSYNNQNQKYFFEKEELKIILDLYQRWFQMALGKIMGSKYPVNK